MRFDKRNMEISILNLVNQISEINNNYTVFIINFGVVDYCMQDIYHYVQSSMIRYYSNN